MIANESTNGSQSSALARIKLIASEFESCLREGIRENLEGILEQHPKIRVELLRELLPVELRIRREMGEAPNEIEFRSRFPNDTYEVDSIFPPSHETEQFHGEKIANGSSDRIAECLQRQKRFKVQRRIGRGGFGLVFEAFDTDLQRHVALKFPREDRFRSSAEIEAFLNEAQTAANLSHPGLVAVHDVHVKSNPPFIVQEFIDGPNIARWQLEQQPSLGAIVEVLSKIADALGYLHENELVHCDLKLANVLMDSSGSPHVADFGLTIHRSYQKNLVGQFIGTFVAMAPEQTRGESHLLDARTDIWAFGIMLYQLLTGRLPFEQQETAELFHAIQHLNPTPPCEIDSAIPLELERICFRCLAKQQGDRYESTEELKDDLLNFLRLDTDGSQRSVPREANYKKSAWVVPKGLRPFDSDDAEFFPDLLPGPKDRNGMSRVVRFWKSRIEPKSAAQPFRVGLIYGPSGCGKTSLVKSGVIPRLSRDILPIYVEATSERTENAVLTQLHKQCQEVDRSHSLSEACSQLRQSAGCRDQKVLIVIDQFEQWLHRHENESPSELINALRQCDGENLQAVLMVRDDFYLSANRMFRNLEILLEEGINQGVVDLFDLEHARKVLMLYGQAYDRLGERLTIEQSRFLDLAVSELADHNKVVGARLALFADMMKSRPWVPASLKKVGGFGGLGATFLEETFSIKSAPRKYRIHEPAVREILNLLLPEEGTGIKGAAKSAEELQRAAGYEDQAERFQEVLSILDSEVKLITPAEFDSSVSDAKGGGYQLTHDFLVPSIREWLTQKAKETRSGRARLRLAELSSAWEYRPEKRNLPSFTEWANIHLATNQNRWSNAEQKLMRQADRLHFVQMFIAAVLIGMVLGAISWSVGLMRQKQAELIVDSLMVAPADAFPFVIDDASKNRRRVVATLDRQRNEGLLTGRGELRSLLALSRLEQLRLQEIVDFIPQADPRECNNIVDALEQDSVSSLKLIRGALKDPENSEDLTTRARFAIVAMYLGDASLADEMLNLRDKDTASDATVFAVTFKEWHADEGRIASLFSWDGNDDFRFGINRSVGALSYEQLSDETREVVGLRLLDSLYQLDSAHAHNSTKWLLKTWGIGVPAPAATLRPTPGKSWWYEGSTLCFVRIPEATIQRESGNELWMSSCEVPVALFRKFADDRQYRIDFPEESLKVWVGADSYGRPPENQPAHSVTWEEAVLFCNWLSRKQALAPCYSPVQESRLGGESRTRFNEWKVDTEASGYRLPSQTEWKYACVGSFESDYWFGSDDQILGEYDTFVANSRNRPAEIALKCCNHLGLHDMHGNVSEWSEQFFSDETKTLVNLTMSGSWLRNFDQCHVGHSNAYSGGYQGRHIGFRICRRLEHGSEPDSLYETN